MKHIIRFIAVFLLLALLVACASGEQGSTLGEATAEPDEAAATDECSEGFRFFDHELLSTEPVCVPESPQRVIALESFEALISLDAPPVATFENFLDNWLLEYPSLADDVTGIESIGVMPEPSIETMLTLEPDLIIGSAQRWSENYDDFSTLAPTVLYDFEHSGMWREVTDLVAEMTNRQEEYNEQLQAYEARVDELRQALGQEETIISVVRIRPADVRLYTLDSFPGEVIGSVGLQRPESQQYTNAELLSEFGQTTFYEISTENIEMSDGDVVFLWTTSTTEQIAAQAEERLQALRDDPIWGTLNAVQAGAVYEVEGYWIGSGFIAAHYMLDDLYEHVLGTEPESPNPFK